MYSREALRIAGRLIGLGQLVARLAESLVDADGVAVLDDRLRVFLLGDELVAALEVPLLSGFRVRARRDQQRHRQRRHECVVRHAMRVRRASALLCIG